MDKSQFVPFRSAVTFDSLSNYTPHVNALECYYSVMAENATFTQILPQIGFLLLKGTVFFLIAVWRFKFE